MVTGNSLFSPVLCLSCAGGVSEAGGASLKASYQLRP
jgi:hypothetical protein